MRNAFVKELIEQMNVDKNAVLLTADVGWNSFDHIREKYPDRFVNMGLSEQSMAGVAAGMAKMGKNVFMYSIIPFMLYRAFEQIRDDICYPDLSVRLVGTGASFSYGEAGSTHQPFEDLRIASALPNMVVLSPSDPREVEVLFKRMKDVKHPVYMRLGRTGEPSSFFILVMLACHLRSGSFCLIGAPHTASMPSSFTTSRTDFCTPEPTLNIDPFSISLINRSACSLVGGL